MNHTVGPWHISDKDPFVVCANIPSGSVSIQTPVADVCNSGAMRWREEEEANARLIAAAPELLEALEHALNDLEHLKQCVMNNMPGEFSIGMFKRMDTYELTIAKAKGE